MPSLPRRIGSGPAVSTQGTPPTPATTPFNVPMNRTPGVGFRPLPSRAVIVDAADEEPETDEYALPGDAPAIVEAPDDIPSFLTDDSPDPLPGEARAPHSSMLRKPARRPVR